MCEGGDSFQRFQTLLEPHLLLAATTLLLLTTTAQTGSGPPLNVLSEAQHLPGGLRLTMPSYSMYSYTVMQYSMYFYCYHYCMYYYIICLYAIYRSPVVRFLQSDGMGVEPHWLIEFV